MTEDMNMAVWLLLLVFMCNILLAMYFNIVFLIASFMIDIGVCVVLLKMFMQRRRGANVKTP